MKTLQEIKDAAKQKLVGYNEKEIECFVQGAMFMAGNLPQRRSDEWYEQQAQRKAEGMERSEAVCEHFKHVTGLGAAVENIKNREPVTRHINDALAVVFKNILKNPGYRAVMLDMMDAEDKSVSREILHALAVGIKAFNECHKTQLNFMREEENNNEWTLSWDEPL